VIERLEGITTMREIALHLLDIAENSVAANATLIEISVLEDLKNDRLKAVIVDNGKGMDTDTVLRVSDPFVTTRTTRKVGLGIPLLKAAAEACDGHLKIDSHLGKGTRLEVEFQRSHIDRMPLGDLASTILTSVVAYPNIRWLFSYKTRLPDSEPEFLFDNQPIMENLGDIPLCEPEVLAYLRRLIEEGISDIKNAANEVIIT
jgi:anti-sigma regulatory factor (Ser/Thr protein kinase)